MRDPQFTQDLVCCCVEPLRAGVGAPKPIDALLTQSGVVRAVQRSGGRLAIAPDVAHQRNHGGEFAGDGDRRIPARPIRRLRRRRPEPPSHRRSSQP